MIAMWAVASCGGGDAASKSKTAGTPQVPVESTTSAKGGATAVAAAPSVPTHGPRVVILGTSLTAGYGLDDPEHDAYPAALQRIADSLHVPVDIVPAGLSGETSAGALRRADWVLQQPVDVFVIETGANDGLRGLDPDSTAANIRALIANVRKARPKAHIVLVQMEAPTNLGAGYTRAFHAIFPKVAASEHVTLAPFLLDGVAGIARLNQRDGIHPTPEGARKAARNLWPTLEKQLGGGGGKGGGGGE
ncbi:MAG: arylesterase [Gemmatimonadetes bacterium]|nr:arylesterase [Gemmatimonadota bacterium]